MVPAPRLDSLDALRGFDMLWIIGADTLGAAFERLHGGAASRLLARQFGHSEWAGFTFYDLIFPLFVFMVGVSVTFSLGRLVAGGGRGAAVRRVLRRGLVMYLLGVFFYGGVAHGFAQVRWVGVLQRLAFCYIAVGLLSLYVKPRGLVVWCIGLLAGYWALLTLVAVPGFGAGDYARGHNLANWIDAHYLPGRVWYGDYDPEGILSTLPAIASCLLGVFAGRWLRDERHAPARRALGLIVAGGVVVALGEAWGLQFPVVKRIWTSSFVLVAGGWSSVLLGVFYYAIDVRGWRGWAQPFVWVGTNAITIYLVSHLVDFGGLSARLAGGPVAGGLDALWPGLGGLALAAVGIALCVGLCGRLHARKIFLKL